MLWYGHVLGQVLSDSIRPAAKYWFPASAKETETRRCKQCILNAVSARPLILMHRKRLTMDMIKRPLVVSCSRLFFELQRDVRRRKRRRLRSAEPEFHHNVYVVLLSKAALRDLSILRRNPERDPSKPAVYVGMTGLPVDHRFENHKNGYKSARLVRKYGVRLLPELFEHLNPMPYEHAVQMEKDLAEDLRAQGFAVCGGT
jgi:hypothetical protein